MSRMRRRLFRAFSLLLGGFGLLQEKRESRPSRRERRIRQRRIGMVLGVAGLIAIVGVGGVLTVVSGIASIKASSGHWAITAAFLSFSMKRSIATHSLDIKVPPLGDPALVLKGAGHYESGCRFCHGSPGAPLPPVAQAMTPHPPPLQGPIQEFDDAGLFYIVTHGVKFTGMPAWPSQKRADEVWSVVAFLRRYPELDERGYRALVFGEPAPREDAEGAVPHVVLQRCARCHGVDGLGRHEGAFPKLAGQRPAYLRETLLAYRRGERHSGIMQPIAVALDERQIEEVVRWYATRAPPTGSGPSAGSLGERIALEGIPDRRIPACSSCHGPGLRPRYPIYPRLAGQYASYLELQLTLFMEGRRGGTKFGHVMRKVLAHTLKPDELRAVADYYSKVQDAP